MRSKGIIQMLTGAYSLVRKTGLLEVPIVRRGFVASSFAYKKYYEDPFWGLAKRMPQMFQSGDVLDIGANIGYTAWVFSEAVAAGSARSVRDRPTTALVALRLSVCPGRRPSSFPELPLPA